MRHMPDRPEAGIPILLPQAYRARLLSDGPHIAHAWREYLVDGSTAAFQRLCLHYLPIVTMKAFRLKRRHPDYYVGEIDDLISDGSIGLMRAISTTSYYDRKVFWRYAGGAIARAIYKGVKERHWLGRARIERLDVIASIRVSLVQQLGRLPSREELMDRLSESITNAHIYIDTPAMLHPSQEGKVEQGVRAVKDSRTPQPLDELLDRETIQLALKGLQGADRQILKCLLNGMNGKEIAAKFGIPGNTLRNRLNGLLWEARSRADLAKHLGVQPTFEPPQLDRGRHLPAIATAPPAKLAVG